MADRIGLGPQAHPSRILEGPVLRVDDALVIPEHVEFVATRLHGERVPGAGNDRAVPSSELATAALHDVVEPNVVLERVRTREVVVVLVLVPEDDAAGLVDV